MKLNNNLIIDQWYPTLIGICDNPEHNIIEKDLVEECLFLSEKYKKGGEDWVSNKTYNTLNTYNILQNKKFDNLNRWVCAKILEYSNDLKYKNNYNCVGGWFNIYKKYDYQEYHDHGNNSLSAVYFLKSNLEKSSKIFFKFKNDANNLMEPDLIENSNFNAPVAWYYPVPGRLLIFKSTTKHCVERHEDDDIRISLAYNFNKIL
jgi:uncharacterized protein (TIGR02466 family)